MTVIASLRFRLDWEPVDESVRAPELRATWARLEVWVGDTCATLVEDLATGSVRRSIVVSLYPLAEWIAYNWWTIRFDGREDELPGHSQRRNFRSAGDGFNWPDLEIVPAGGVSSIKWSRNLPLAGDPIRYLSHGHRWVDTFETQGVLSALVSAVVTRLEEAGVEDTPLQKEWARVAQLDPEEVEFCEAAARLGLDPLSEGIDIADQLQEAFSRTDPALIKDFFDAAPTQAITDAVAWINESLTEAERSTSFNEHHFDLSLVMLASQARPYTDRDAAPWSTGYAAARAVRDQLAIDPTESFPDDIPVRVLTRPSVRPGFTGVGKRLARADWTNLVVGRPLGQPARRFAAARALWHATQAPTPAPFLLTSAHSNRQRIGRAFAAELLAPAAGIRAMLGVHASVIAPEDLSVLGEHFRVSEMVIGHQIENQLQGNRPPDR
jgi:hypothetical protein